MYGQVFFKDIKTQGRQDIGHFADCPIARKNISNTGS